MILKTLSIFVLLSIVLFIAKQKVKAKILLGFSFLILFVFSLSPIADYLIQQVQPASPSAEIYFSEKNVIVLVGGGSNFWPDHQSLSLHTMSYSRVFKAFEIYQNCKRAEKPVCHLLVTGGDPQLRGQSEFELIANELKTLGVESQDIVKEDISRNTHENAFYSSELIRNNNYTSVVLVTSGFHIQRAERWFLHFKISSQIAPSDSIEATQKYWPSSKNLFYSELVVHELLGLLQIQIKNYTN